MKIEVISRVKMSFVFKAMGIVLCMMQACSAWQNSGTEGEAFMDPAASQSQIIYSGSLKDPRGIRENIIVEKKEDPDGGFILEMHFANRLKDSTEGILGTLEYFVDFTFSGVTIRLLEINSKWRNLGLGRLLLKIGLSEIEKNPKIQTIAALVINSVARMMFSLEGFDIVVEDFDSDGVIMEKKIIRKFGMPLIAQKSKIGTRKMGRISEKGIKKITNLFCRQ